jgi:hypothetical protein
VTQNFKEKNCAMSVSKIIFTDTYYIELPTYICSILFMIASFSKCTDKTYSNRNLGGDIWLNGPVHYSKLACQEKNRKDFGNSFELMSLNQ